MMCFCIDFFYIIVVYGSWDTEIATGSECVDYPLSRKGYDIQWLFHVYFDISSIVIIYMLIFRSDLMVKKLRYYARFIVVCLLLKKMKLVRDLVMVCSICSSITVLC